MTDTKISLTSIYEICRSVTKEEFSPISDENIIFSQHEEPPKYPFCQLILDANDEFIGHQIVYGKSGNPVLVRHAGRQKTFIAHFNNATLVQDSFSIIASENRMPFPNNYNEYSIHHLVENHTNRSNLMHAVQKVGPQSIIKWEHYLNKTPENAPTFYVDTPHIILANLVSMSYFHFMMDVIPRLWIYEAWPHLRTFPILVRPMGEKFEQALADAVGVPRSQIIVIPPNVLARFVFKHLVFPSGLCDRMVTEKQLKFICSKTVGSDWKPSERPWRRVFMSRNDRPYRNLDNEDEVVAALAPYGFERVVGANMSIPEQAKLFGETEMLVGVLGGGWTNMMFMSPGMVCLELTQREPDLSDQGHQVIMELANVCRLHHMMLTSDWDTHILQRGNMSPNKYCPTAMTYDVNRIVAAVEAGLVMLSSSRQGEASK